MRVILFLSLIAPGAAAAQEAIPREVVMALFGPLRGAELLVGRLPDPLPHSIALPEGARPIGALVRRDGGTIAVAVPDDGPMTEAAAAAALAAAGWRPWQQPAQQGGFVSTGMYADMRMFCSDDAWARLHTSRGSGHTVLRVDYGPAAGGSPCQPGTRAQIPQPPLPTLGPPDDAMVRGAGRSSSSEGRFGLTAHVETGLATAELAEHYARELTGQGWTAEPPTATADVSVQRVRTDADGGYTAVLIVVRTAPGTYEVDLKGWPGRTR